MDLEKLKAIGEYIIKGMSEQESCVLVDVPWTTYLKQKENRDKNI